MSAPLPTDWNFTPGNGQGGAPSSIAGALPGSGGGTLGNHAAATFYFSSMNPTILSSTVIGPRSIVYYRVSSGSSNGVLTTTLTNNLGASVATITWWDCPVLGIPAVGLRHKVRDWLQKSSDGRLVGVLIIPRNYSPPLSEGAARWFSMMFNTVGSRTANVFM